MYKRHIFLKLEKALKRSPVVLLNGARQVGKTTLALEFLSQKGYSYQTFDDEILFLTAQENIVGFVNGLQKPVILDEVQRIPEIFRTIKLDVDRNRVPGNYFLTGSANPLLIPTMGDSLAGRMEIIDIMPLSQGEIYGKQDFFIDRVFSKEPLQSPQVHITKEELYKRILTGGYPLVQHTSEEDFNAWMRSYLSLLLQRDIRDLASVERLTEFPNLLKILASRAAGLMNIAAIAREIKLNAKTVERYLALLQAIFIITPLKPWSANLTLRFVRSEKLYFVDSGLLAYLLGINLQRAMNDSILMGKIMENFIVSELRKQATWNNTEVELYHFRTSDEIEVDIVLEDRAGNIVGIEVKNSQTVTSSDFKGLRYLQEKVGKAFVKGIVLYAGVQTITIDENLQMVPINSLWE